MATEVEWTAARCNRLLRPLRVQLTLLENDRPHLQEKVSKEVCTAESKRRELGLDGSGFRAGSKSVPWFALPCQAPGRKQKTYSTDKPMFLDHYRPLSLPSHASRVKAALMRPQRGDRNPKRPYHGWMLARHYRTIIFATESVLDTSDDSKTKEMLSSAFNAHRVNETQPNQLRRFGAPTLRSMAVRAIPRYFDIFDEAQKEKSKFLRVDIAEIIYRDLECFAMRREWGRPVLSDLLRSHATNLICNGLRAGFIATEMVTELVHDLSLMPNASREAETLLSVIALTARPNPVLVDCPQEPMLRQLAWCTSQGAPFIGLSSCGCTGNILSTVLDNQFVPVEWFGLDGFLDWDALLMDAISGCPNCLSIFEFLEKLAQRACGTVPTSTAAHRMLRGVYAFEADGSQKATLIRHKFATQFSLIFSTLASAALIGGDDFIRGRKMDTRPSLRPQIGQINLLLHGLASEIINGEPGSWIHDEEYKSEHGRRCGTILFCALLVSVTDPCSTDHTSESIVDCMLNLESNIKGKDHDHSTLFDHIPDFFNETVRLAAKHTGQQAHDYMRNAMENLLGGGKSQNLSLRSRRFLNQVCMRAARDHYADPHSHGYSGLDEFMVWVEMNINPTAGNEMTAVPPISNTGVSRSGSRKPIPNRSHEEEHTTLHVDLEWQPYRWDPIITEFVKKTPKRPQPKPFLHKQIEIRISDMLLDELATEKVIVGRKRNRARDSHVLMDSKTTVRAKSIRLTRLDEDSDEDPLALPAKPSRRQWVPHLPKKTFPKRCYEKTRKMVASYRLEEDESDDELQR